MTSRWGRFLAEPLVRLRLVDALVVLAEALVFVRAAGERIVVPAGFRCDGASIPRWLWSLFGGPLDGPYRAAAFLHDWLYAGRIGTRWAADNLFYEAMRALGMESWRAILMWAGVRLFGGNAWRRS